MADFGFLPLPAHHAERVATTVLRIIGIPRGTKKTKIRHQALGRL